MENPFFARKIETSAATFSSFGSDSRNRGSSSDQCYIFGGLRRVIMMPTGLVLPYDVGCDLGYDLVHSLPPIFFCRYPDLRLLRIEF